MFSQAYATQRGQRLAVSLPDDSTRHGRRTLAAAVLAYHRSASLPGTALLHVSQRRTIIRMVLIHI